jgi:hypothetical protein
MTVSKEFISAIIPTDGDIYITEIALDGATTTHAFTDIDDAIDFVEANEALHNVYYSMASFNSSDKPSRKQNNVKFLKSLWLDIDSGEGDKYKYKNKKAAGAALADFCKNNELPWPSLINDSGNGLHAYWVLDTALTLSEWQPLAEGLKQLCINDGFDADHACTADAARILRPVGTTNHKGGHTVKAVHQSTNTFPPDDFRKLTARAAFTVLPQGPGATDEDELGADGTYDTSPRHMKYIVEKCDVMKSQLATGGATASQTLWQQTLLVSAYCEDGAEYAHKLGHKHPDYNESDTTRRFNIQKKSRARGIRPIKCTTFAQSMPEACANCAFRGDLGSPLQLGKAPEDELPFNYYRKLDGRIYFMKPPKKDDDGPTETRVCSEWLGEVERTTDAEGNPCVEFRFGKKKNGLTVPYSLLNDTKRFHGHCLNAGLAIHDDEALYTRNLMTSFIKHLARVSSAGVREFDKLGWNTHEGGVAFRAGDKLYLYDGEVIQRPLSRQDTVIEPYKSHGSLDKWKKIAQWMVDNGTEEQLVALAAGFGAPLMKFTGQPGAVLSLYSRESARGKSMSLHVSSSIWGHPRRTMHIVSDTPNQVMRAMGQTPNMPHYWDELRGDVSEFNKLIFQIAEGREKNRLYSTTAQNKGGLWETMLMVGTNKSLVDDAITEDGGGEAGIFRVFEIPMPPVVHRNQVDILKNVLDPVRENYGVAGEVFAGYLAANTELIKKSIARMMETLTPASSEGERYWVALAAAILVGAAIARKLGLVNFDLKILRSTLIMLVNTQREERQAASKLALTPVSIVERFVAENNKDFFITDEFPSGSKAKVKELNVPLRKAKGHRENKTNMARISIHQFDDYARKKGMTYRRIAPQLLQAGVIQQTAGQRFRLGAGLDIAAPTERCFVVDLDALDKATT